MLLKVLDALGVQQTVITKGQEAVTDQSGNIAATGVAQEAIAANALRSGLIIQNISTTVMYVNDLGDAAVAAGSYQLAAGATFPPEGWPVTTGAVSILGTVGALYTAREW